MKLDNFWLNSAIFVFTVKAFWTILLVMVLKGVIMNGEYQKLTFRDLLSIGKLGRDF